MSEFNVPEEDGLEVEVIEEQEDGVETETIEFTPEKAIEKIPEVKVTVESPVEEESRELTPSDVGVEISEIDELKFEVRKLYAKWQQSWFWFGKKITDIQTKDLHKSMGYVDFKDFCSKEFPELSYPTVVKMIRVVKDLGASIEAFINANPDSPIPARESLYLLQISKDKAEKAADKGKQRKIDMLISAVMVGDLSYYGLREKLREIESSKGVKTTTEVIEHPVEIAVEHLEESEVESIEEEVVVEGEIEISESGEEQNVLEIAEIIEVNLDTIKENCGLLLAALTSNRDFFTPELQTGINKIDEFSDFLNDFLNKIVELTNRDD